MAIAIKKVLHSYKEAEFWVYLLSLMWKGCFILTGVFFVISLITTGMQGGPINLDVDVPKQLALESTSHTEMLPHLRTIKSGMEFHGLTNGYATRIFPRESDNLAIQYRLVREKIAILEELEGSVVTSESYSATMLNVRDSLTHIPNLSLTVGMERSLENMILMFAFAGLGLVLWLIDLVILELTSP